MAFHRPQFPVPSTGEYHRQQCIAVYHPAYRYPQSLLVNLPQVDAVDSTGQPTGLHHRSALLACQIIAHNAFEKGKLYFDQDGKYPVIDKIPLDGALPDTSYFFILGSDPKYRYPVVPSFRDWQFPHDRIPETYVIPVEEEEWFTQNGMNRYGGLINPRQLRNPKNLIYLRADIRRLFDAGLFAIAPKPELILKEPEAVAAAAAAGPTNYVVHVFGGDAPEFCGIYHNRLVPNLVNTSPEYLFARFAWAVLHLVNPFVMAGTQRKVILYQPHQGRPQWAVEEISGATLATCYVRPPPGTISPGTTVRPRVIDVEAWASRTANNAIVSEEIAVERARKRARINETPWIDLT
ncbi:hypothetical protein G7Z17_g7113 [Cylindrodendrum hubeiense]|uniref:HNH nuclease domain-containing protein n=1 Tax=Cylindrodendrum hubeiense TaxID=595255 RepID=A0A9P5LG33_9HYPO|nr:hypothetical protein G7Z17_g7113 [Cylindrodendrum hubeiense]